MGCFFFIKRSVLFFGLGFYWGLVFVGVVLYFWVFYQWLSYLTRGYFQYRRVIFIKDCSLAFLFFFRFDALFFFYFIKSLKSNNLFIEVFLILLISLLVFLLLIPSISYTYYSDYFYSSTHLVSYSVFVTGNQWYWDYSIIYKEVIGSFRGSV